MTVVPGNSQHKPGTYCVQIVPIENLQLAFSVLKVFFEHCWCGGSCACQGRQGYPAKDQLAVGLPLWKQGKIQNRAAVMVLQCFPETASCWYHARSKNNIFLIVLLKHEKITPPTVEIEH